MSTQESPAALAETADHLYVFFIRRHSKLAHGIVRWTASQLSCTP